MMALRHDQFADSHHVLGANLSPTLEFSSGIHRLEDLYQSSYSCRCPNNCVLTSTIC